MLNEKFWCKVDITLYVYPFFLGMINWSSQLIFHLVWTKTRKLCVIFLIPQVNQWGCEASIIWSYYHATDQIAAVEINLLYDIVIKCTVEIVYMHMYI